MCNTTTRFCCVDGECWAAAFTPAATVHSAQASCKQVHPTRMRRSASGCQPLHPVDADCLSRPPETVCLPLPACLPQQLPMGCRGIEPCKGLWSLPAGFMEVSAWRPADSPAGSLLSTGHAAAALLLAALCCRRAVRPLCVFVCVCAACADRRELSSWGSS